MSRTFEEYPDGEKISVLQLCNAGKRETIMEQREDIEEAHYELAMLREAIEMEGPKTFKRVMKRLAKYKRQNI